MIKSFFKGIGSIIKFLSQYFKGIVLLIILIFIFSSFFQAPVSSPNLVMIDLTGAIKDSRELVKKINKANKEHIKGVLLYVDSPGGALAPSVEISLAIKELQQNKPVIAYAAGTMASGSYYASIYSDKIYANAGAFIGSIGVIMQGFNIKPLADKLGIEEQVVSAGDFKQAGTWTRKWSDEEKQELNNLIKKTYNMFVSDVAKARNLDINKSDEFANARVFLASDAKKVGLIDELGTLQDAKNKLVEISQVTNAIWQEPDVIEVFMKKLEGSLGNIVHDALFSIKAY